MMKDTLPTTNPTTTATAPSSATSAFASAIPVANNFLPYAASYAQKKYNELPFFTATLRASRLRYYFLVNHLSIASKLKLLVVPFLRHDWKRVKTHNADDIEAQTLLHNPSSSSTNSSSSTSTSSHAEYVSQYAPLTSDDIAPDFYLPLMSFLTYILMLALCAGISKSFSPDIFSLNSSYVIVIHVLELVVIRLGYMLIAAPSPSILDLIAYTGYIYFYATCSIILGLMTNSIGLYSGWIIFSLLNSIFIMRTLKRVPIGENDEDEFLSPPQPDDRNKRVIFLMAIGAFQWVFGYILIREALPAMN